MLVSGAAAARWASIRLIVFDFDGVFTDNAVYVSQDGVESVRCCRSDGLGLARLRSVGIPTFIISTEANPVVTERARKLKIGCIQAIEDKAVAITSVCAEFGVALADTMFVGNDINDIPAFRLVGHPVGVADAYPEVVPFVEHRTQRPGGYGAVREVCDMIFAAREAVPPAKSIHAG